MYLVIIEKMIERYAGVMKVRPSEKFFSMVHEVVMNHVIDKEEPPEQIRTAVLNVADDMMAGRDVTLRAGDYIALMDYAREIGVMK
ncbi:MAG: hypothetical protein SWO11_22620 [Thermodesulfobacteriota bacterium]|nr:hypothetical protein [Thermodesulfobacteriota bacterium]